MCRIERNGSLSCDGGELGSGEGRQDDLKDGAECLAMPLRLVIRGPLDVPGDSELFPRRSAGRAIIRKWCSYTFFRIACGQRRPIKTRKLLVQIFFTSCVGVLSPELPQQFHAATMAVLIYYFCRAC